MRINYVLVDLENIGAIDLKDLDRENIRVIIFLGSHQKKIGVDMAIQMQALGERGEYVQISGQGPNALDFHIAFTIGEKCAAGGPCYFHIISKDLGFDPLVKYLKQRKFLAGRYATISELPILKILQLRSTHDRATYVTEKLGAAKVNRPRTAKTLLNAIQTLFQNVLSVREAEEVLEMLKSRGFVAVTGDKVTYGLAKEDSHLVS